MMTGTLGRSALTFGSISSPLMPGMLISDKIRISDGSGIAFTCSSAAGADSANSMMKRPERRSHRKCWRNMRHRARHRRREYGYSICASGRLLRDRCARQRDNKFGEITWLSLDINSAAVLLHDDVVRHGQTKAGSFTGWLGREERVEHLFPYLGWNADAVVANANFHAGSEVLRGGPEGWLKTGFFLLGLASGRSIDAVRDQIEKC